MSWVLTKVRLSLRKKRGSIHYKKKKIVLLMKTLWATKMQTLVKTKMSMQIYCITIQEDVQSTLRGVTK